MSKLAFAENHVTAAKRIGIQLYTLKDEVKNDFKGTLKKIAEVDYKEFEFEGYHNNDPKDIKKFIEYRGRISAIYAGLAKLGFIVLSNSCQDLLFLQVKWCIMIIKSIGK